MIVEVRLVKMKDGTLIVQICGPSGLWRTPPIVEIDDLDSDDQYLIYRDMGMP